VPKTDSLTRSSADVIGLYVYAQGYTKYRATLISKGLNIYAQVYTYTYRPKHTLWGYTYTYRATHICTGLYIYSQGYTYKYRAI